MKVLHLTLHKKWYDLILSGKKTEEYRDVKEYWIKRLSGQTFDVIHFKNGYRKDAREMTVECTGCVKKHILWEGSTKEVFALQLGKILSQNTDYETKKGIPGLHPRNDQTWRRAESLQKSLS
jgi:ribosomal protein S27E